jgi:hypothetical protein
MSLDVILLTFNSMSLSFSVAKSQNIAQSEIENNDNVALEDDINDSKRISQAPSSCTVVSEFTPSELEFANEFNCVFDKRSLYSLDSNALFTNHFADSNVDYDDCNIANLFDNSLWTSTPIGAIRREKSANSSDTNNEEYPLKPYETVDYPNQSENTLDSSTNYFLTAINTTAINTNIDLPTPIPIKPDE